MFISKVYPIMTLMEVYFFSSSFPFFLYLYLSPFPLPCGASLLGFSGAEKKWTRRKLDSFNEFGLFTDLFLIFLFSSFSLTMIYDTQFAIFLGICSFEGIDCLSLIPQKAVPTFFFFHQWRYPSKKDFITRKGYFFFFYFLLSPPPSAHSLCVFC